MRVWIISLLVLVAPSSFAEGRCPKGDHWVGSHHRRSYTRHDGVRVSATQVKGHCRENPSGYEQWHQRLSNKRPKIWGYKKEKSKRWTVEEVQRFYGAISVLPGKLINLKNVNVYRMKKSKFKGNPATSNFSEIVLYDSAFQHKDSLAQILSHELSHVVYRGMDDFDKNRFTNSAGWVQKQSNNRAYYSPIKNKVFIQIDSRDSISEDFANHMEHFLFKRNVLRTTSPEAYKWIFTKYGKEFKVQGGEKR